MRKEHENWHWEISDDSQLIGNLLRNKLDYSRCVTGNEPEYLIMSYITASSIASQFKSSIASQFNFLSIKESYEFEGIPIAYCNKLKFGEIDIK